MAAVKLASTLILCMVMSAYVAEAAITCGTVIGKVSPCIPYATGKASTPPSGCCGGIKSLTSAATTPVDRQTLCKCLKSLAGSLSGVNYNSVGALPRKCGVSVPYAISPSTNCNGVK